MEPIKPTTEKQPEKISTSISGDASVPFISVMAKDPSEVSADSHTSVASTPASEVKKETSKPVPPAPVIRKGSWTQRYGMSGVVILFLLMIAHVAWTGYQALEYRKTIQTLQSAYDTHVEELAALKASSSQSEVLLGNLYNTLSNVINEEKIKNEALEAKLGAVSTTVGSLDKLSKSDPQLLKKYSKVYFLNENYTPFSLAVIPAGYTYSTSTSYQFHSDAAPFLLALIDAAKKDKVEPLIISAYRSFTTQATIKKINVVRFGTTQANQFSAEQGFSEHQLGTTVDFTTRKTGDNFNKFETTPEYEWLKNNAHKYGFALSYPKNNAYYAYEPWHWRFVGVELAGQLHSQERYFYDYDQRVIDGYLTKMFDK